MLFNSFTFAAFFVVVFSFYWALRKRVPQNVLLLTASWVFYGAWSVKFLLLLIASSLIDYTCARLIERSPTGREKKFWLVASVGTSLLLLATFKYLGFFVIEFAALLRSLGFTASEPVLAIVLPVGISFYTFQTIGYVVDVYRGKVRAVHSLLEYGLYVAFFPQLVAGPIERAGNLIPQFQRARVWSTAAFESGIQLIGWGLFKKVAIADNLAPYVDVVYGDPTNFAGPALATATVFFAFQIYCDFSGYTDIARGVARTLGFELVRNFDFPYFSRSPIEFWRRWHMSLSQWFQDYLYYPLAMRYMRRGGFLSKYKAHIVSMALIGIWHGANWTFLVFGLYWGIVIALYLAGLEHGPRAAPAAPRSTSLRKVISVLAMFALACAGWVLFRAPSIADAWYVLTHMFSRTGAADVLRVEVISAPVLWLLVGSIYVGEWVYVRSATLRARLAAGSAPAVAARAALITALLVAHSATQLDVARPFIYFQF